VLNSAGTIANAEDFKILLQMADKRADTELTILMTYVSNKPACLLACRKLVCECMT
jgi:hypothetical protein